MLRAADPKGRCEVLEVLDKAAALGLTVLRTWAFSDGPGQWRALQRAPGVYDENTFAGLDFVIHQVSMRLNPTRARMAAAACVSCFCVASGALRLWDAPRQHAGNISRWWCGALTAPRRAQASLRGIRVLLAFGNYWQHYGGVDQARTHAHAHAHVHTHAHTRGIAHAQQQQQAPRRARARARHHHRPRASWRLSRSRARACAQAPPHAAFL
jgi:hypothetical protein